jgi:predicted neutral ceramidase superfamily lipid hydrolase
MNFALIIIVICSILSFAWKDCYDSASDTYQPFFLVPVPYNYSVSCRRLLTEIWGFIAMKIYIVAFWIITHVVW